MKKKYCFIIITSLLFSSNLIFAQITIKGTVLENNPNEKDFNIKDAHIYWLNSNIGTTSDNEGNFEIKRSKLYKALIISAVGYKTDTIEVNRPNLGKIRLYKNIILKEVTVKKKVNPLQKSLFSVQNVITVDNREMLKAACCNLSESFETNPSVDVNVSDGITGAKQIQMLGLNSPYLLFTQENMPSVKGASQIFGLSFIPGSWIESIQITKGAGNIINGYESISGQINTELVKPLTDKKLFLNVYANNYERYEFNSRLNTIISDKISTGLYLHANLRNGKVDNNSDGFLDIPLGNQVNFMSRWQFLDDEKGWVSFLNIQGLIDEKQGGEIEYDPDLAIGNPNLWGSQIKTKRIEISSKVGYVFPDLPYQSFGLQASYSRHNQDSNYGNTIYNIEQSSFYSNLLFNSIIQSTQHKFKTGISFTYDNFDEQVNNILYDRIDHSLGSFFEYSYDSLGKLRLVAGIRIDHHNRLNTFITPRLHLRYSLWDKASLRASIGRGKRGANIFSENQQIFASSRNINISSNNGAYYGLDEEIAWNYGISFSQKLYLLNRAVNFSVDFYRTNFKKQVIVDLENPREVNFYNLEGDSYSNTLQVDLDYEILRGLNIRTTYKNYHVSIDYKDGKLIKPLQPEHRIFINLNYETEMEHNGSHWRFDTTFHWDDKQRIPNTEANIEEFRLGEYSKSFGTINAQITKVFSTEFEIYLGGENISNVTQDNPIIASTDPFGPYFDSTIIYAPIIGSTYYLGLRYKL